MNEKELKTVLDEIEDGVIFAIYVKSGIVFNTDKAHTKILCHGAILRVEGHGNQISFIGMNNIEFIQFSAD